MRGVAYVYAKNYTLEEYYPDSPQKRGDHASQLLPRDWRPHIAQIRDPFYPLQRFVQHLQFTLGPRGACDHRSTEQLSFFQSKGNDAANDMSLAQLIGGPLAENIRNVTIRRTTKRRTTTTQFERMLILF